MPKITLTKVPQQITNGSQHALLTSNNRRAFAFTHSEAMPTDLLNAHSAEAIDVRPPFKVWAWSNAEVDIDAQLSVVSN